MCKDNSFFLFVFQRSQHNVFDAVYLDFNLHLLSLKGLSLSMGAVVEKVVECKICSGTITPPPKRINTSLDNRESHSQSAYLKIHGIIQQVQPVQGQEPQHMLSIFEEAQSYNQNNKEPNDVRICV